jgi:hypothetical protein
MRGLWLCCALLTGCSSRTLEPLDGGALDLATIEMPASGFDFAAFAADVTAASTSCTTPNCAAPLPNVAVASPADAHQQVQAIIARVFAASVDQVNNDQTTACSTLTSGDCATQFNHSLYKGDGCRADALTPAAKTVIAEATSVELAIWRATINGITSSAAVTIAGVKDGKLLGIMFFFNRTTCSQ